MADKEKKKPVDQVVKTNSQGYNYKYADLLQVNKYIQDLGYSYFQETDTDDGVDYIFTNVFDENGELKRRVRGARIVNATLSGKSNPAQEWGSAITYARRYSLYLAFGLAVEDDDGEVLTESETPVSKKNSGKFDFAEMRMKVKKADTLEELSMLWKEVPAYATQYLQDNFTKRKQEIGQ